VKELGESPPVRRVALKKIKISTQGEGVEMSALREIKSLKKISSRYVVKMHECFIQNGSVNIVLEYLESDLEQVIKNKEIIIMPGDIKAWLLMILKGLYACHRKFVIHRDVKPNNILIDANGVAKLADFGLAREIGNNDMTYQVVTRWYRAPELLFGYLLFTFAIDIWALGCVFAELFLRTPYFPADDDFKQLDLIFRALGTPSEKEWPDISSLPLYVKYPWYPRTSLKSLFTGASDDAIDLLGKMLTYDPLRRITCLNALKHSYFTNLPRPTRNEKLPSHRSE
jgi:cyclin-dependent kinase 7